MIEPISLCLLLQRYTFWSNSQHTILTRTLSINCACYCKDTHFEAIHNEPHWATIDTLIVLATAKIHILKQFTTGWSAGNLCRVLCLLLQRYTFWSNSQPHKAVSFGRGYCACYCKDTHFEAIHNGKALDFTDEVIVLATAKIHILKQFTTTIRPWLMNQSLCLLLQRYTFWSNSQQCGVGHSYAVYCACYCKDTHFEAIHNPKKERKPVCALCLLLQRYTFWSNSQPATSRRDRESDCACYCKDTHFEAIHNKELAGDVNIGIVLATAKIHILKQFTTMITQTYF